jgi:hypothetical protein
MTQPTGRFPVAEVIARLREKADLLRLVESAADLQSALDQQPAATPAAYVITARGGNKPAGMSGGVLRQTVNHGVQVVLFVKNYSQAATGGGAAADMDALSKQVDDVLLNWAPTGYHRLSFAAGQDHPKRNNGAFAILQQRYISEAHIQVDKNP